MADTRTPASRRAAASTSASRLPSARERRPALAALAVLLIVGGAFASGFLALQAGNRADYLRVKVDVPQGAEITEDHLESVSLPEDMDGVIAADDEEQVVGLRSATHLLEGTILTEEMVTDEDGIEAGQVEVPFGVDPNNIDPSLESGAWVRVYAIVNDEGPAESFDGVLVSADSPDDGGISDGGGGDSIVQVKVLLSDADAEDIQPAVEDESITGVARIPPPENESDADEDPESGE